jgi:hypothetical protein
MAERGGGSSSLHHPHPYDVMAVLVTAIHVF